MRRWIAFGLRLRRPSGPPLSDRPKIRRADGLEVIAADGQSLVEFLSFLKRRGFFSHAWKVEGE